MLPKDQNFKNLNLTIDGEIGGNLIMIGTATLNSLGLKRDSQSNAKGSKRSFSSLLPQKKHTLSVSLIVQTSGGSVVQSSL